MVPQDGEDISGDTVSISFTTNYVRAGLFTMQERWHEWQEMLMFFLLLSLLLLMLLLAYLNRRSDKKKKKKKKEENETESESGKPTTTATPVEPQSATQGK